MPRSWSPLRMWIQLVDETVKKKEEELFGDFLVSDVLMGVSELWKSEVPVNIGGRIFRRNKHLRTELAVALFESYLEHPVDEKTWKLCLLMDSIVNSADDIADYTPVIPKEDLFRSEVLGYISWPLFVRELESSFTGAQREAFFDNLVNYSLKLSRIPIVEKSAVDRILSSKTHEGEIKAALDCYFYRAVDIDIFVSLVGISLNVDEGLFAKIRKVAMYMRARAILEKDIADLEFDIKTGANTPLVAFLKKYGVVEHAVKEIRSGIYTDFLNVADEKALTLWDRIFGDIGSSSSL